MRENFSEVVVGALVLAIAGGFLAYSAKMTGFSTGTGGSYALTASFRSAEGVSLGTDVRMSGVKVGSVTALALNPETFRADATLDFDATVPVPNDSTAVVASEGLLGGSFIEIMPGGSLDNFAAGEQILDTQGAVSLVSLLVSAVSGSGGSSQ